MVEITLEVPESLAERLEAVRSRLPEVLAHGLDELSPLPNKTYRYILEFLVSQPSPEAVLTFKPTSEMQARVEELLEKNRAGQLSPAESAELDEYVRVDHLITMLKAHTLPYLPAAS
ncbi:MAG TPA: hypothetical protein VFL17_10995 [Anaerolineae bacterium]|nr:hypothetical protein [Anaerolineae bacterium]